MALKDMTLRVKIKAEDKASKKIAATGDAAQGSQAGLKGMAMGLKGVGIAAAGVMAVVGGFIMFAKFLKDSISIAIEFEDVMIRTQAVTNSTGAEMEALEGKVRGLAKSTRFTATEVANAAQIMAIAGVSIDEMVSDGALERMLELALVGGVDVPTAAGIAIAAIKGFRLEMTDLGRVNDVVAKAMTSTNVTMVQMGEALKYLGPTAAATGISIEESAAAIGALGNAGIQGTLAGTQLRQAINKLIAPSEDARRVMNDLNLNVFRLTPAGYAAQNALKLVSANLNSTKAASESLSAEIKSVSREMQGMSLSQQRNNLRIMEIRRRAEKQGRDLTAKEIEQIAELENRNKDLDISLAQSSIARAEMSMRSDELKDSEKDLQSQFTDLNQTTNDQVQGLTSLVDVLSQLQAAGASTAQIMEIFGVRGGGAILALLGQSDGFKQLVTDLYNAEGAAAKMAETIGSSTAAQLDTLKSALQEEMIALGQEFLPVLRDELIPLIRDDLVPLLRDIAPAARLAAGGLSGIGNIFSGKKGGGSMGSRFALGTAAAIAPMFMADGGLVTSPTSAIIGEAGPEVVIPLDRFEQNYELKRGSANTPDVSQSGVTINSINISGVMNANDVSRVISDTLPSVLSQALRQNTRGSF